MCKLRSQFLREIKDYLAPPNRFQTTSFRVTTLKTEEFISTTTEAKENQITLYLKIEFLPKKSAFEHSFIPFDRNIFRWQNIEFMMF
jgi:hypothetical protein